MKRIALINNGVVENVALWDGITAWNPEGFLLIDITDNPDVDKGWLYDGNNFQRVENQIPKRNESQNINQ